MTAGLPGFGLGGVFFIISALLAPFGELIMTVRGRSSRARWASVGRQLLIALAMIFAVGAMLGLVGLVSGAGPLQALMSPLLPLTWTGGLLVFILVTAKLVQLLLARRAPRPTRQFGSPRATHRFQTPGPLGKTEAS